MDYLIGLFACCRIGAIAALVNVRLADELEYYVNDHTPRVVLGIRPIGCVTLAHGTTFDENAAHINLKGKLPNYDLTPLSSKIVAGFP
jgi:acyl-CoA synthetase (AMP-forming)/AMP-acid ligase II